MRKFYGFGLLMLLSSMFFGVMTVAQTVTVDNIEYYCYYYDGTAKLMNGKSATGDVVIPAEVEYNGRKYRVTTIYYPAFWNNTAITSVKIPTSVNRIDSNAFGSCTNLTSITSDADMFEEIGSNPFDKTPWLDNLQAENGLKYWKKWVIGTDLPDEAEDVHIKEGTIGMSVKDGSIRGKTLYIPKSLSKLDNTLDIRVEKMVVDTKNPTLFSDSSGAVYKKDGESMYDSGTGGYIYVKGQILYRMPTNSPANTYKVAEGTKALARYAGWGNNYERIIVPEGCEAVIVHSFRNQKRCKYIELPSTVNHFSLYYPIGASMLRSTYPRSRSRNIWQTRNTTASSRKSRPFRMMRPSMAMSTVTERSTLPTSQLSTTTLLTPKPQASHWTRLISTAMEISTPPTSPTCTTLSK